MPNSISVVSPRQAEPAFPPHLVGYRVICDIGVGTLVVSNRRPDRRGDASAIAGVDSGGKLQANRARHVGDAICHALNSGMDPDELLRIAAGMVQFARRHPIPYAANVTPIGMTLDRHPGVRYVLQEGDDVRNVQVIWPDIRTEILSRPNLAATIER